MYDSIQGHPVYSSSIETIYMRIMTTSLYTIMKLRKCSYIVTMHDATMISISSAVYVSESQNYIQSVNKKNVKALFAS